MKMIIKLTRLDYLELEVKFVNESKKLPIVERYNSESFCSFMVAPRCILIRFEVDVFQVRRCSK